jgi:hypothetical protein
MIKNAKATNAEKKKRVSNFYAWLEKANNKFLHDAERMDRAILIIEAGC